MDPATTRRLQAAFAAALFALAGATHAAIQSQSRNAAGTVAAGGSWANANNARIAEARDRFAQREAEEKRLSW